MDGFILDFENALFDIKIGSDFKDKLAALTQKADDEIFEKEQKKKKGKRKKKDETPEEQAETKDAREMALLSPEGRELFRLHVQVTQISNVWPRFLYMSRNEILGEQYYVFSVD